MSKIDYKALREAAEAAKGKTTWQKLSCTCVRSGGAFMQGDDVLVFMVELPDSYGLPRLPFYWPLVLAFTKEGFVDVATGATFKVTWEV